MSEEYLIKILEELKKLNVTCLKILEQQESFPVQELLNPNGALITTMNDLIGAVERN